jgi:hypothetical protein
LALFEAALASDIILIILLKWSALLGELPMRGDQLLLGLRTVLVQAERDCSLTTCGQAEELAFEVN